ncbi:MAG: helix-turn-helix transcriptional regulator [Lachnospiraceae bacterium]|nr:helix-turn-helix transcriptional regulator [Lachnospiraceae bacterium]
MDQKKVGSFLKELRKEKGVTQERFAEILGISGRTVSRWETGSNMPDISLLVEIAEFFDVSIPEIINGERKSESMNQEIKEVAESLSDYASVEKETMLKEIRKHSIMGTIALVVYCILDITELVLQNVIFEKISLYCETLALVTIVMIFGHTTGLLTKLQKRNSKMSTKLENCPKVFQVIIIAIVAFGVAAVIKLILTNLLGL